MAPVSSPAARSWTPPTRRACRPTARRPRWSPSGRASTTAASASPTASTGGGRGPSTRRTRCSSTPSATRRSSGTSPRSGGCSSSPAPGRISCLPHPISSTGMSKRCRSPTATSARICSRCPSTATPPGRNGCWCAATASTRWARSTAASTGPRRRSGPATTARTSTPPRAGATFAGQPGRRVQIAWMRGGKYPGMPFNQQMTFPCDLTLPHRGRVAPHLPQARP